EEGTAMALERWRPFGRTPKWEPFRELADIQTEMNWLFDRFFGRPAQIASMDGLWAPVVDLYESNDELVVSAELPGVKEKEIQVTLTGDLLTIRGERTQKREVREEHYHRLERVFGKFERNIPLPIPVRSDKVKATYRDGVLEIRLPKTEEAKPRAIKVDIL
ncbi:MAG: Hsp20/alpha crystallin family protein, partial [Candidatus Methylomirabilia bacterium]